MGQLFVIVNAIGTRARAFGIENDAYETEKEALEAVERLNYQTMGKRWKVSKLMTAYSGQ